MSIGKYLDFNSGNFSNQNNNSKNKSQRFSNKKEKNNELKEIYNLWKKAYFVITNRICILTDLDRKNLKMLYKIFGFNDLKNMIYYYFKNYKNLPFYNKVSIPKTTLLVYFKDDFFENSIRNCENHSE